MGGARSLGSSEGEGRHDQTDDVGGLMSGVGPQRQGAEQGTPDQHCSQEHAIGGQGSVQRATPSCVGSRVRVVMSHCLTSVPEAPST